MFTIVNKPFYLFLVIFGMDKGWSESWPIKRIYTFSLTVTYFQHVSAFSNCNIQPVTWGQSLKPIIKTTWTSKILYSLDRLGIHKCNILSFICTLWSFQRWNVDMTKIEWKVPHRPLDAWLLWELPPLFHLGKKIFESFSELSWILVIILRKSNASVSTSEATPGNGRKAGVISVSPRALDSETFDSICITCDEKFIKVLADKLQHITGKHSITFGHLKASESSAWLKKKKKKRDEIARVYLKAEVEQNWAGSSLLSSVLSCRTFCLWAGRNPDKSTPMDRV